jgi:GR25 family glycosyltransferase involved in LPS biosynthesis
MNSIVVHIYVINMKKDKERLNKFKNQVDNLFTYEIWEGVDIKNPKYASIYNNWLSKTYNITYDTFNWKYYIERYKDLRDTGILTKDKAWWHWNNYGKKELRSGNPDNEIVNKGQLGCLLSHLEILKNAEKNNYEKILILEDDIIVSKHYHNFNLSKLKKYSEKYDIIYLGTGQHDWVNISINKNTYIANNTTGTFAYIIHKNIYGKLIELISKFKKPIDQYYIDLQKTNKFLVVFPNLFYCDLENSNISNPRSNSVWYKKFKWD